MTVRYSNQFLRQYAAAPPKAFDKQIKLLQACHSERSEESLFLFHSKAKSKRDSSLRSE
jgi:hypothetical protein